MSECPPSHTRAGELESVFEFAERALEAGGHLADDVAGVFLENELADTLVSDDDALD